MVEAGVGAAALALVGVGADDITLKELQAVFGFESSAAWAQTLGAKIQMLRAAGRSGDPILAIANRVFAKCTVRPEHAAVVVRTLGAEVERLDSEQQVNGFVERETRGMIKRIVTAEHIKKSKLIAVNAIYFKGKWKHPFQSAVVAAFYPAGMSGPKEVCHLMASKPGKQWEYHDNELADKGKIKKQGSGGAILEGDVREAQRERLVGRCH